MTDSKIDEYNGDFTTPEYHHFRTVQERAWEMNRGLGYSYGYNRAERQKDTLTVGDWARLLIDVVAKNGNLLMDFGPKANGDFSKYQMRVIRGFAKWMRHYG